MKNKTLYLKTQPLYKGYGELMGLRDTPLLGLMHSLEIEVQ